MTNRELSKLIGVSPATLSLVINNKPGISVATRTMVLEKLESLGYQSLIKDGSSASETVANNNISFIVYKRCGNIVNRSPFFLLIMESIENCAHKYGFNLLFHSIDRRNSMTEQLAHLTAKNCKGAVIFATEMHEDDLKFFTGLPIPYVLLDNDFPYQNIDSVAINNGLGTHQAIEYLVRMGHSQIGYLKCTTRINSFKEREIGFTNALQQYGIQMKPEHIFELDYSEEGSFQEFKKILDNNISLPSAFVTDDDTIAVGAMKALQEKGIRIPEDVSIIGFNDRPLCEISSPALSSIRVPKYAFGAMSIELLVKRIHDSDIQSDISHSLKYRIGTEAVLRKSVSGIFSNR